MVILEAMGTFLKSQKSRSDLEYYRNISNNWLIGMEKI